MTPYDFLAIGFNVSVGTLIAYGLLIGVCELVKRVKK